MVRVPSSRRTVLGAALAAPFAGWARADSSVGAGIPLVPGYEPDAAYLRGRPLRADAVAARALPAGYDGIVTMVSRVDTRGGETRRALMPISGHAIAVAPGGADALWVGMNDPVLLRFATETLDVLGMALPHAEGYVFGGHAVYAIDRGVAFVAERRDPGLRFTGSPEDHTGRIAVRDPDSLAVLDVWNGHGVPQDYAEAVKWYRLAADEGLPEGQLFLGLMYWSGLGVPQDYVEAAKWYHHAANQWLTEAQHRLGVMYANGQGVPQDYVQAHMWFNLAGSAGNADAVKFRDIVAERMTPDQIAEAQRLAGEWIAAHPLH